MLDLGTFQSAAYLEYEQGILKAFSATHVAWPAQDPAIVKVRQLAPEFMACFEAYLSSREDEMAEIMFVMRRDMLATQFHTVSMDCMVRDLFSGRTPVYLSLGSGGQRTLHSELLDSEGINLPGASLPSLAGKASSLSKDTVDQPVGSTAAFRMSRQADMTISNAWKEYDTGLGGRPSVRSQYEEGGLPSWSRNATEHKFWRRRKVLIDYIKEESQTRQLSPDDVAARLDELRLALPRKEQSLAKVTAAIKAKSFRFM
ncbi:MAG: hypothetical protein CYPHOPRED_002213 [Cyphobasidiales sp. Tagirdzhanova-0007]|nr:MAG: hypothetical protein CYPHOPRED_002213 [Cyphobasidiales sp. Tagirdzhanova-0007]